jgi:nitroreductase
MIKSIARRYFPNLFNRIKCILAYSRLINVYFYDINRYFKLSDYYFNDNENRCMMRIIHRYHPIEKGLTMSEMRPGFGVENINLLLKDCVLFREKYLIEASKYKSASFQHYYQALGILQEYLEVHNKLNYELDYKLVEDIKCLITDSNNTPKIKQINTTSEKYFEHSNAPFPLFAKSRYSLRNFKGSVSIDNIIKAIDIAQKTPSACNRQPARVHIIDNENLKNRILELQGGNRGFGHQVDKLIIITSELVGYRDISERNNVYVDGGMFAMSLLYSLHSYKIGSCPLNWCASTENDIQLRKLVSFPNSQTVILMIACGAVPENFKLAYSLRSSVESINSIIKESYE